MEVKEALKTRRSIRKYKDKKVPRKLLEEVVKAGQMSHSAINDQPWHFVIIDDDELVKEITEKAFVIENNKDCPVVLITFGKRNSDKMSCGLERSIVDTSIATSYMQLRAHDLGLGACWIGAFRAEIVEEILEIPQEWQAMHITTLGFSDESPNPRKRKSFEEVVSFNGFF